MEAIKLMKLFMIIIVVEAVTLWLFVNWAINQRVVQNKATACPTWLESVPQKGCE